MKVLAYYMYRDPAKIVEIDQINQLREKTGCAGCQFSTDVIFGKGICGVGNVPGKRGYCKKWRIKE